MKKMAKVLTKHEDRSRNLTEGGGEGKHPLIKKKKKYKIFFFTLDPNIYKQRNDSGQVDIFVKKEYVIPHCKKLSFKNLTDLMEEDLIPTHPTSLDLPLKQDLEYLDFVNNKDLSQLKLRSASDHHMMFFPLFSILHQVI